MKLSQINQNLESFLKKVFPGLEKYESEKGGDIKIEHISFIWEMEKYHFLVIPRFGITNCDKANDLIEEMMSKQLENDLLKKQLEAFTLVNKLNF